MLRLKHAHTRTQCGKYPRARGKRAPAHPSDAHTDTLTHAHMRAHTGPPTSYIDAHCTHICAHHLIRARTHTHTHTYTHTCTHTHTYTYIHARSRWRPSCPAWTLWGWTSWRRCSCTNLTSALVQVCVRACVRAWMWVGGGLCVWVGVWVGGWVRGRTRRGLGPTLQGLVEGECGARVCWWSTLPIVHVVRPQICDLRVSRHHLMRQLASRKRSLEDSIRTHTKERAACVCAPRLLPAFCLASVFAVGAVPRRVFDKCIDT